MLTLRFSTQQEAKRQRKISESVDTGSIVNAPSVDPESDEEGTSSRSAMKKIRAQVAETIREKERRELDKVRAQQRADAAKGRQARAGRRRGPDGGES